MEKRSSQSSLMLSCTGIFHMYLNKHPQDRNATFSAREETPKTLPYQVNTTSFCASFNVFTSEKYLTYSFLLTQKPCYPFRQIIGKVGGKLWAELSNSSKRTPCSVGSGALCHELPCSITEKGTCGDLSQHTMLSQNLFSLYVQFINCEEKKYQPVKVPGVLGSVWVAPSAQRYEVPAVCSVLTLVKHWAVWEYLVWPLSRRITGFGAGPGTRVLLDHGLGKASVIWPV